jgi:hypothetical protein
MTRISFGLILVAVLVMVSSTSASANYWRRCGSQHHLGAGWYYVKSHNLHCAKARRVASHYAHSFDSTPYDFSCTTIALGEEAARVLCRREVGRRVQRVRFTVGA